MCVCVCVSIRFNLKKGPGNFKKSDWLFRGLGTRITQITENQNLSVSFDTLRKIAKIVLLKRGSRGAARAVKSLRWSTE